MGNNLAPPPQSDRITDICAMFYLTPEKLKIIWATFLELDKDGKGHINVDDYFNHYLQTNSNQLTLSMLELVGVKNVRALEFSDYLELICTFSCMEHADYFKFIYYCLDPTKVGSVDKHEIRHFVHSLWDFKQPRNVDEGMEYLDTMDPGDGRFGYKALLEMISVCPMMLAPAYDLQTRVMRTSLGVHFWETHRFEIREANEDLQKNMLKHELKKRQAQLKAEKMANEHLVKHRMGVQYYLCPCMRQRTRDRVAKIVAMTAEIAGDKVEKDEGEGEEGENKAGKEGGEGETTKRIEGGGKGGGGSGGEGGGEGQVSKKAEEKEASEVLEDIEGKEPS